MGEYYWWMEYGKVMLAYLVLVFVYPSILFRNYLKGKGRIFWFGFCVTSSILLISTAVILLGLVHLLNVWVVRILFWGSLIWSISRSAKIPMTPRYFIYKVQNRTYGGKLLAARLRDALVGTVRRALAGLWQVLRRNFLEVALLFALVAYGVLYYSWTPIHTQGYGFSDIIVHHYWAYGLQQGKIFIAGIYPEAMHCMAYAMSTLFGIKLYNVILFIQCANIIAFLVSIYLFGREVAGWKGSALVMLAVFLTMKLDTMTEVYIMSRLQAALPQEFGLYAVFLIPAFLLRYLKNARQVTFRGKKTKFYWDENLVVFTLGIAASISIHFYATVMALFSCLGVIVVWFYKIFHWRRFVPLALAAFLSVLLSFGPMLLAFASGIPFQGSIFWALNVMKPEEEEQAAAGAALETTQADAQTGEALPSESTAPTEATEPVAQPRQSLSKRIQNIWKAVEKRIKKAADGAYYGSFKSLYRAELVDLFLFISKYAIGLAIVCRLLMALLRLIFRKRRFPAELFDGYAMVVVICMVFMMAFSPGRSGFPKLIAPDRVCAAGHAFLMCLLALPVDLAGTVLSVILGKKLMSALSAAAVAAVFYLVISSGNYHGYLYMSGTRYNAAVNVTASIVENIPEGQYTILSTTDELYQVMGHGFHEEILTFQRKYGNQEYYIPTKYMFFYVEKHPIRYGHTHFSDGPQWLALQIYPEKFGNSSVGDQMSGGEISQEIAEKPLILGSKLSNAYTNIYNREIVEARMARYLEAFEREYPNELNIYYEDDDFICYCLEQNTDRLFNLGLRQF